MRKLLFYGPAVLIQSTTLAMTLLAFYLAVCLSDAELLDVYNRAFGSVNPGGVRITSFVLLTFCIVIHTLLILGFMPEAPKAERKESVKTDCTKCKRCKLIDEDGDIYCTVYGRMFHKAEHCDKMKARYDDADT